MGNIVLNPGFEERGKFWTLAQGSYPTDTEKYSGKYSLRLGGIAQQSLPNVWMPKYWYLRFRYKPSPDLSRLLVEAPAGAFYMVRDPTGRWVVTDPLERGLVTNVTIDDKPLTGGWREVNVKYYMTELGVKFVTPRIHFGKSAPGTCYLDDVYLSDSPPPVEAPAFVPFAILACLGLAFLGFLLFKRR